MAQADPSLELGTLGVVFVDDRAPEDAANLFIDHQNRRVPLVERAQSPAPMADLAGLHDPVAGQIRGG